MGDPVNGDGQDARIAEDDLVSAFGGGIAFQGGNDVGGKDFLQVRQGADEFQGQDMTLLPALDAGLFGLEAVVLEGENDLPGKALEEFGCFLADTVFEVGRIDAGLGEITGKKDAAASMDNADNGLVRGDGDGAGHVPVPFSMPGAGQLSDHRRNFVIELEMSSASSLHWPGG